MFRNIFLNDKINTRVFYFVLLLLFLVNTVTFVVDETEMAVVLQFGKPVKEYRNAGLYFKLPWPLQSVTFMEKRYFLYDSDPREVLTDDKKTLVIDNFAPIRITDPIQFLQNTVTMTGAQERTDDIVYSHLHNVMGKKNFDQIVIKERELIMDSVTVMSNHSLREYALTTVMVRLNRVDLPPENREHVVGRMISERKQEAELYRSEGRQKATEIRSASDKEKEEILAEADRTRKEIIGRADAEATKIYNLAYSRDPYFFNFLLGLETTEKSLVNTKKRKFIFKRDKQI